MSYRTTGIALAALMSSATLFCPTGVLAQSAPAAAQPVRHGEIDSDDVYVRSGPSTNHYTVTKLAAGQPVTIVGETLEWYEIIPPDGTFSLISGDYVDAAPDGSTGVVNGDRVRVRTGSLLNDNKYTVQTLLSKGAALTILGRNPDGFLRIVPPEGATVWVHKSLVALEPGAQREVEGGSGAPVAGADSSSSSGPDVAPKPDRAARVDREAGGSAPSPSASLDANPNARAHGTASAFAGAPTTAERRSLDAIDIEARAEMAKPLTERRLDPILERYTAVAAQERDVLARRYAQERIRQLRDVKSIIETVRNMQKLSDETASARRRFLEDRASIPTVALPAPSGLDVEGVLRTSALYPPGRNPRRYRLVDGAAAAAHTIGYVDFPPDFAQPLERYVDRRVGVRAAERSWQKGSVEPVAVYVARELVLLRDDQDVRMPPKSSAVRALDQATTVDEDPPVTKDN